jgi:SAM-dependent methyltransferase
VSRAEARTGAAGSGAAADDWEAHWSSFSAAAERNPAQAFRRRLVLALLATHGPPQRYLDIGSGPGDMAVAVAARWPDAEVAGIDLSRHGVDIASRKLPRARFRQFDLLSGEPPPAGFQGWATQATCSEVLEHVDEPETLLGSARRWLAPGALLVVTVPGGPMSAFDRHIGHRRHYTTADLRAVLRSAGFDVLESGGAGFPFFNVYRRTVIARGDRLVADVDNAPGVSFPARAAMAVFNRLLAASPPRGRRGWQLYGVARLRHSGHGGPRGRRSDQAVQANALLRGALSGPSDRFVGDASPRRETAWPALRGTERDRPRAGTNS